MKVARTVEQACSILAVLAEHHGEPVTNSELNERLEVSLSYLIKITRKLVMHRIISSTQGAKGGFVLAKPMNAITLRMVVEAIEGVNPSFVPSGVIERVFRHRRRVGRRGLQALTNGFKDAERAWRDELDKVTMEALITSSLEEGES